MRKRAADYSIINEKQNIKSTELVGKMELVSVTMTQLFVLKVQNG